jgi:glutamate 5-kinase
MTAPFYKKIVVKIGSNVLTGPDGLPDVRLMKHLTDQLALLKKQKRDVILVSSGAVAAGRSLIKLSDKYDVVAARQLLASVGQVKLINIYTDLFKVHDILGAQVLVTKEDFRDRQHYLNMRNCFTALLQNNIIPIVNENDVISVTELMFTDNDELTGLIASMMGADAVVILTNVDGIYDDNPKSPDARLIPVIDAQSVDFESFVSVEKSNFGRGGMITKCKVAHKLAQIGINVHIANGKTQDILTAIIEDKPVGTRFLPQRNASHIKRWIAHSEAFAKGVVYVNDGAKAALTVNKKATSLLPVGINRIDGEFEKGDIIKVKDENGEFLALGKAQYSSERALEYKGKKNHKALIHYDYLFINPNLIKKV